MSPHKGQHSHHVLDSSVVERRLRPIYDWLDNANNKKALQECEKVLKKTPNLQCAKALKALTIHRMGKEQEAAAILEQLVREQPTDDATLQAMALCYKELQQLSKICQLYETAVKLDPTNEELNTQLFMSYVRVGDFRKQQHCAMALFKHRPKTPYYCWAVMSVVLQATRCGDDVNNKNRSVLLNLAERMMEKLLGDDRLDAEQELQLYIMVLELQKKYSKILDVINSPLGEKLVCSNGPANCLPYMAHVQQWSDMNMTCKRILRNAQFMDRWDIWRFYVDSVRHLYVDSPTASNQCNGNLTFEDDEQSDENPEKSLRFISALIASNDSNNVLIRGPFLARFELWSLLEDTTVSTVQLFIEYFQRFGHKSACVNDLTPYLRLLNDEDRTKLPEELMKLIRGDTYEDMQRHLGVLQLRRMCDSTQMTVDDLTSLVTLCKQRYQSGYERWAGHLLATDMGPSDMYGILGAHALYDLGVGLGQGCEPLLAAITLLESVLAQSPANFHAKLLCIRLYHAVGGTLGAHHWYIQLDTKFLQLDSLGFVHCARLPTTGLFSLCANLYDATLRFFETNYRESSDHWTFSYKYGSFVKLNEFMEFRERLNNSLHYTTVAVDRTLLNIIECTTLDALYNLDFTLKDGVIDFYSLRDNSDYGVYLSYDPERLQHHLVDDTPEIQLLYSQNLSFVKLRMHMVWALTDCIVMAQVHKSQVNTTSLKDTVWQWRHLTENIRNAYSTNIIYGSNPKLVTLPLPSRLPIGLLVPSSEILCCLFDMFCDVVTGVDTVTSSCDDIRQLFEQLINVGDQYFGAPPPDDVPSDNSNCTNLFERRDCMELMVNCVELLSLSVIVCCLCVSVMRGGYCAYSGGKKRGGANSAQINHHHPQTKNSFLHMITQLVLSAIEQFLNYLTQWTVDCEYTDVANLMEALNLRATDGAKVRENVLNSFTYAARELHTLLQSKQKMLKNLIC